LWLRDRENRTGRGSSEKNLEAEHRKSKRVEEGGRGWKRVEEGASTKILPKGKKKWDRVWEAGPPKYRIRKGGIRRKKGEYCYIPPRGQEFLYPLLLFGAPIRGAFLSEFLFFLGFLRVGWRHAWSPLLDGRSCRGRPWE
jgi:hypothetical protein